MEHESSLHFQEPVTYPYPEPDDHFPLTSLFQRIRPIPRLCV